ncbi:MAG: UPF0489 family protein [Planctomycetaceae bacterium]|jgi:hypothetical protein|nr:UPF0489 family protein [Planctomycetaceae bacterium]
MSSIIIVEEHHEVFPIWLHYFRKKKDVTPMTLLRFDAHDDLRTGFFATDLRQLPNDEISLQKIIHSEFHFDDYILPAVYLGIFDHIIWMRPEVLFGGSGSSEQKYVRSWQDAGKSLILGNGQSPNIDAKHFTLKTGSLQTSDLLQNIDILDIEYDYFYCVRSPCVAQRLEITHEEYRRYETGNYHFARLHFRTIAEKQDGRFYLVFYPYHCSFPSPLEIDNVTLSDSVHRFCETLINSETSPKLITLCRAVHSGYCRQEQALIIEEILLDQLPKMNKHFEKNRNI